MDICFCRFMRTIPILMLDVLLYLHSFLTTGLPRSGKNVWKVKFFPGQGKFREFCA